MVRSGGESRDQPGTPQPLEAFLYQPNVPASRPGSLPGRARLPAPVGPALAAALHQQPAACRGGGKLWFCPPLVSKAFLLFLVPPSPPRALQQGRGPGTAWAGAGSALCLMWQRDGAALLLALPVLGIWAGCRQGQHQPPGCFPGAERSLLPSSATVYASWHPLPLAGPCPWCQSLEGDMVLPVALPYPSQAGDVSQTPEITPLCWEVHQRVATHR